MKKLILCGVAVCALGLFVGCGNSVQGQCQAGVNNTCALFKKCNDGGETVTNTANGCDVVTGSGSFSFTLHIGTKADGGPTCFAGMTGNDFCSGGGTADGGTYNAANADACNAQISSATCDSSQTTGSSGPCAQVCQ